METRYFLFETMATKEIENDFLSKIVCLSESVSIFKMGIGEFILSIKADFDDNCETENATALDVIHNFRKTIKKIKEYNRKPTPQKQWIGEWINLNN